MSDLISRQKVMWILTNLSYTQCKTQGEADVIETAKTLVITMPPAQSDVPDTNVGDMISRQAAIDAVKHAWAKGLEPTQFIEDLPSAQPEPLKITIDHAPTPDELERLKQAMRNTPIMLFPSAQPERCEDCENFSKTRLLIPQPDIIRCRDCKYGEQDDDGWWYCRDTGYSMGDGEKGDGFCSYAERKTDE